MTRSSAVWWSSVALAIFLDCAGNSAGGSSNGVDRDGGDAAGGAFDGSSGGDGGDTDSGAGSGGGAVDAGLELRPPPPDRPRPSEVDDCSFGGSPGDIVGLFPPGSASVLTVGSTWVTFNDSTLRGCTHVGSGVLICEYDQWLRRVPRCGGEVETLGAAFGGQPFTRLEQGGGYIYALTESMQLFRVNESDGSREEILGSCVSDVAAGPDDVVVFSNCADAVLRAPHTGKNFEPIAASLAMVKKVAIGTSIVYFTAEQGIGWVSLETGDSALLPKSPASLGIAELGADHRALFVEWSEEVPASGMRYFVTRIPLTGGSKEDYGPWDEGVGGFPPIEVRGGFAYHSAPGFAGGITRISSSGGSPPETMVRREYDDVAAYGDRVYWTERGAVLSAVRQGDRVACPGERMPDSLKVLPSTGSFILSDVALDPTGNVVVIGTADTATDLGGGPLAADLDHMILAKLDRAGNHVWSRLLDGASYAARLAVGGTGVVTVATPGFVARFSPAGAPLGSEPVALFWALVDADTLGNSFVSGFGNDGSVRVVSKDPVGVDRWQVDLVAANSENKFEPSSVSAAGDGGVFIAGMLNATLDFGDGPRDPGVLPTTLVARIAPDGQLAWSRRIVGDRRPDNLLSGGGGGLVVATPSGAVIVGSTDFSIDAGTGPLVVPQAFDAYAYVVRLAPEGVPISARLLDFSGAIQPVVTDSGDLYVVSGGCPGSLAPPGPSGVAPTIVFKLDQSDSVVWGGRIDSDILVKMDADYRAR